jgi:transcriptional regulator with XRE-family HTH domain
MTPEQCRAARAYLGWPRRRLASVSGVSALTILYFENSRSDPRQETLQALEDAFVAAGIEFFRNGLRFKGN